MLNYNNIGFIKPNNNEVDVKMNKDDLICFDRLELWKRNSMFGQSIYVIFKTMSEKSFTYAARIEHTEILGEVVQSICDYFDDDKVILKDGIETLIEKLIFDAHKKHFSIDADKEE